MTNPSVAVIGAGSLGLFTAYELAKQGASVTVYERFPLDDLHNSSWGNAGHILPAMSVPVTSVGNITSVLKSVFKRDSFMVLPHSIDRSSAGFLTRFARNSSRGRWLQSVEHLVRLNRLALSEFERVQAEGVAIGFERAPFVSAFASEAAARTQFADLLDVCSRGLELELSLLDGDELHKREPLSRAAGRFGLVLENQGLVQPPTLMRGLLAKLSDMGVEFVHNSVDKVEGLSDGQVRLATACGGGAVFNKAVVCSGSWLNELASPHGVRPRVLAGFGYSLRVDVPELPEGMLYFPEAKIATTRMGDSLRISTLLQIDSPNMSFDARGGRRLNENARRVLPLADWDSQRELWHGGRPISSDGMPIIGETRTRNVYANGGHGMWGVTLGPVSGRLLAEAMLEGRPEIDLTGFSARR